MLKPLDTGTEDSEIALLLDFPHKDAMYKGDLLSGRAGYTLHQLLNNAGIAINQCFITYCHDVQDNKGLINTKGAFSEQGNRIREETIERFKQVRCNIIVPLGPFSCATFTGDHRIKYNRGSLSWNSEVNRKILPTFSPGNIMFQAPERLMSSMDFKKVLDNSKTTHYAEPQHTFHINPSVTEADNFLEYCKKAGTPVSVDIETLNGFVFCIGFCVDTTTAMCINFDNRTMEEEIVLWRMCAEFLEDETIPKLGQNLIFDIWFLAFRHRCYVKGYIDDTMVAHHILYPDLPKGLGTLTTLHTDEPYYKEEGGYWKGGIGDRTSFLHYNCKDVITTLKVWLKIKQWIEKPSIFYDIYRTTVDMYPALTFIMSRGLAIDHKVLEDVREGIVTEIKDLDASLQGVVQEESGDPLLTLNFNSPKQCLNYYYTVLGIKPYLNKGKPTLNDDALIRLAKGTGSRDPLYSASLIQQLRQRAKYVGTYLEIKFDEDERFRCSYNPRGTKTGRLSSSKTIFGTGMNQQNLPQNFKSFIVPDKGKIFIEMDKRQSEWVLTAYISGDKNMIEVLQENRDPHVSTAKLITGLPDHVIIAEDKNLGKTTNPEEITRIRSEMLIDGTPFIDYVQTHNAFIPRTMSCRQVGKKSNHALNYMMGTNTFSLTSGLSLEESDRARSLYLNAYERLPAWWEEIRTELQKSHAVINIVGQPRKFIGTIDDKLLKEAVAHLPQSSSVWVVNQAMSSIYAQEHEAEILGQVHDSLLFQHSYTDLDKLENFCRVAKEALEPQLTSYGNGVERKFYIETDIKVGLDGAKMYETTLGNIKEQVEKLCKLK